ncbi:radical SAM protein [Bradyrhizobium sp. UFLA05-153]
MLHRPHERPFDVRDRRVMVSLGPLTQRRYCVYRCPFCYVQAGFLKYAALEIPDIVEWIKSVREPYDIIYISGDTDSFCPPRTERGLALLRALLQFGVDLLFTTRAPLNEDHLRELKDISDSCRSKGRRVFSYVSVAQLHHPHLEPRPIPSPYERIAQLGRFKANGLTSVLALRPFLPNVPVEEYLEIVRLVQTHADIVVGEVWYADQAGKLDKRVFRDASANYPFTLKKMDFDENEEVWKVFEAKEVEASVSQLCADLKLPFFMRSRPAIEWARRSLAK